MGRPRKRPLDPLKKSNPEKVKVNSKAYGPHLRAPRGSIKEAELNASMKEASKHTISSNAPAALINNALKPFRENFKGGLFFQFLQQHFNAQARKGKKFSVEYMLSADPSEHDFSRMNQKAENKWWLKQYAADVNKNYPISSILAMQVDVSLDKPSLAMHISIKYIVQSRFLKKTPKTDGLQITCIILFPDFEDNDIRTESIVLPIRRIDDADTYSFTMDIPVVATSYMLFYKIEACENGKVKDSQAAKAMVFKQVGEL